MSLGPQHQQVKGCCGTVPWGPGLAPARGPRNAGLCPHMSPSAVLPSTSRPRHFKLVPSTRVLRKNKKAVLKCNATWPQLQRIITVCLIWEAVICGEPRSLCGAEPSNAGCIPMVLGKSQEDGNIRASFASESPECQALFCLITEKRSL